MKADEISEYLKKRFVSRKYVYSNITENIDKLLTNEKIKKKIKIKHTYTFQKIWKYMFQKNY